MQQNEKVACPQPEKMGEFACKDKSQCWEPCGELGNSAEHAKPFGWWVAELKTISGTKEPLTPDQFRAVQAAINVATTSPNPAVKAVQKRLAERWGYTKAIEVPAVPSQECLHIIRDGRCMDCGKKESEQERCPTCGEDEPHTGTCGTSDSDTKALCKRKPSQEPAVVPDDGLRSKDCFYGDDHVQDIAHALAQECEEAELDPNDYVTVNREKLVAIAKRVLTKAAFMLDATPAVPSQEPVTLTDAVKALDDLQSAFMSHTRWNGEPPSEVIAARAIIAALREK